MHKKLVGIVVCLSLLAGCVAEKPSQTQSSTPLTCSEKLAQRDSTIPRRIEPTDLQTGEGFSTPVISNAQKFILPVPAWGERGEPLVYPASYEKAGQPILDYEGKPVGDRGLVFFNGKDQSWQAVNGDGEGVIIINEVTSDQAQSLYQKVQELQPDPNNLTLEQMKEVIAFAQNDLGLVDMYNSSRSFIRENMTPAIAHEVPMLNGKAIEAYGFKKRDARDINQAIYIPGEFIFTGPAASPQEFKDGGVIIEQAGKMRGVQPDIFMRTYKLSDGRSISSVTTELVTQCN